MAALLPPQRLRRDGGPGCAGPARTLTVLAEALTNPSNPHATPIVARPKEPRAVLCVEGSVNPPEAWRTPLCGFGPGGRSRSRWPSLAYGRPPAIGDPRWTADLILATRGAGRDRRVLSFLVSSVRWLAVRGGVGLGREAARRPAVGRTLR